jgi:hypothetical protein
LLSAIFDSGKKGCLEQFFIDSFAAFFEPQKPQKNTEVASASPNEVQLLKKQKLRFIISLNASNSVAIN